MKTEDISLTLLQPAPWNPNQMDEKMMAKLKESLARFGLVEPLVVRPQSNYYEVLSGNQRLQALKESDLDPVPCVIVKLDDAKAKLLAQALNGIRGEDDLNLKAALLKEILESISEDEVISILPETTESLKALSIINEMDMAEQLKSWSEAQQNKLHHLQVRLTGKQMDTVDKALNLVLPEVEDKDFDNPNARGNAIYLLCKYFLERRNTE